MGRWSSCLLSPAIAQTPGVNKSLAFAWGRGLLCPAPQLVNIESDFVKIVTYFLQVYYGLLVYVRFVLHFLHVFLT